MRLIKVDNRHSGESIGGSSVDSNSVPADLWNPPHGHREEEVRVLSFESPSNIFDTWQH